MARMAKTCMRGLLKVVNSGMALVGIAMILYALWMFRNWRKHMDPTPIPDLPPPWFIYSFLGIGSILCLITCSGHIAAETTNGCCLYIYMVFVFLLIIMEAAVTTDIFINDNWEDDFPEDSTGKFDEFKHFVKENSDMCKWIGLSVIAIQGLSFVLAMILKSLGSDRERYYDSDDDYIPDRVPLLRPYVPTTNYNYAVSDPVYGVKK